MAPQFLCRIALISLPSKYNLLSKVFYALPVHRSRSPFSVCLFSLLFMVVLFDFKALVCQRPLNEVFVPAENVVDFYFVPALFLTSSTRQGQIQFSLSVLHS